MKASLKIIKFLQKIPKGKVTTYGILGEKAGIHPRAVGMILRLNKRPDLYPCYKVIASDGSLGGYNLGVRKKIQLLKKDGIKIKGNKVADFERVVYKFQKI